MTGHTETPPLAMDALSRRGRRIIDDSPMPPYIDAHFDREHDAYDIAENPEGYIGLAIAENKLVWPLLEPRLNRPRNVPAESVAYDAMIGSERFRTNLSRFLERVWAHRPLDPAHLAVLAGSGSVLETLFYVIADAGDSVLVPTPSYAGFWADLETRDALTVVPVHTTSESGFRLTTDLLDEAMEAAPTPVRALLYTNPSNPLGTVAGADEVEAVLGWAHSRGIHLVVDEVFALSSFGTTPFVSTTALRPELGPMTHAVWAFSKDFGMSGLRCGVLVTENEDVMAAVDGLAYWSATSGDTQHLLADILADDEWVDEYLTSMTSILRTAYAETTTALERHDIPFVAAEAGLFVVMDLRGYLDEPTWEAEEHLWSRIVEEANVNLTPGSACHIEEPGFMRLVYAASPTDQVTLAVDRIASVLGR